jgi:ketosteroid isomerase-like protein
MMDSPHTVSTAMLIAFNEAWNRHDIDALMTFVTDDCVFDTVSGPDPWGVRHVGCEAVQMAFEQAWRTFPDARWTNGRHFVCGDRGVSEWLFTGTRPDGSRVEASGCDLFTFREGKIAIKSAFRKDRPVIAARPR